MKPKTSKNYLVHEILNIPAKEAKSIVYAPPFLAQFSLPARRIENNEFIRHNGMYTFSVLSPSSIGVPFGVYPRLILIFLATEVRLTQSRFIDLGLSKAAFKKKLGVGIGAGANGPSNRFNDQFKRLFSSSIKIVKDNQNNFSVETLSFARKACTIWQVSAGGMAGALELEASFFEDLSKKSFPVDQRVLKLLGHHCLAYDLYLWLTSRVFNLYKPIVVQWLQLELQFGNQLASRNSFKLKFRKALISVKQLWPELRATEHTRGILISPCAPHVAIGRGQYCG